MYGKMHLCNIGVIIIGRLTGICLNYNCFTFFVVSNGKQSFLKLNRICLPNTDKVPVPVRSDLSLPLWSMSRIRFKYWYSSWCSTLFASPFSFDDFESPLAEQRSIFVVDGTVSEIFTLLWFSERISHLLVTENNNSNIWNNFNDFKIVNIIWPVMLHFGASSIISRKISPDRIKFH